MNPQTVGTSATEVAELIRAASSMLWVLVAFVAIWIFRAAMVGRGPLSKLGIGPSGLTLEFAEEKLREAAEKENISSVTVGEVPRQSAIQRIGRSLDLINGARILWVDDHPEHNHSIVALFGRYGAVIDLAESNSAAIKLLGASRYDVVISDVARDAEGPGSDLKGIELADQVLKHSGQKVLLFTARFNPLTVPDKSVDERMQLASRVQSAVFGVTNRSDELVHLVLDILGREKTP